MLALSLSQVLIVKGQGSELCEELGILVKLEVCSDSFPAVDLSGNHTTPDRLFFSNTSDSGSGANVGS